MEDNKETPTCDDALPWVEKQRPKTLDDVQFQTAIVSTLKTILSTNQMPHMLFQGPPGTGKTSSALALSRQMQGDKNYREAVMELNASDDRSINTVRTKVKSFAERLPLKGFNKETGRQWPGFNVIILDEADAMTQDAQFALRRMIENFTATCRFIIICNYVHKIIDALCSRCVRCPFKGLSKESQVQRLEELCVQESVNATIPGIEAILKWTKGDLRRSVMMLQSCNAIYASITPDAVNYISGACPKEVLEEAWGTCMTMDNTRVREAAQRIVDEGWAADIFIGQMFEYVIEFDAVTDNQKTIMLSAISEADFQLTEGGDEYLQICNVLFAVIKALKTN